MENEKNKTYKNPFAYHFAVSIDTEIKRSEGVIRSDCNAISFLNIGNVPVFINDRPLDPQDGPYVIESSHPLELITKEFRIRFMGYYTDANGGQVRRNPRIIIERKFVSVVDKPLPAQNRGTELPYRLENQ